MNYTDISTPDFAPFSYVVEVAGNEIEMRSVISKRMRAGWKRTGAQFSKPDDKRKYQAFVMLKR